MMRMVGTLNDELLAPGVIEAGRTEPMEVRCATCHHGNNRPVQLQDVLSESLENDGLEAMIGQYDSLRERHFGGWVYDFSERTLLEFAGSLAAAGNVEAAMAVVDKNTEVNPGSVLSHFTRGQILAGAGDTAGARAAFEACLAADPEARFCRQGLERLDQQ